MSVEYVEAPGLPANWINGWLAAIGVTVLLEDVTLHWTDDVVPHAVIGTTNHQDLASAIVSALPEPEELANSEVAYELPGYEPFAGQPTLSSYIQRSQLERSNHHSCVASYATDLVELKVKGDDIVITKSAFNVAAQGRNYLHNRALTCLNLVVLSESDPRSTVEAALEGRGSRVSSLGLGFDIRRFSAGVQGRRPSPRIDPVIELLCWFALELFPVRGDGKKPRTRLWRRDLLQRGNLQWSTWDTPNDRWAIDARLDQPPSFRSQQIFSLVPFHADGNDVNSGFGSEFS